MSQTGYDRLAPEYYDPGHLTTRNFDETTLAGLRDRELPLPEDGLVLDVGCGRGRCNEFLGIPTERIVQLDASRQMLELTPREQCLLRVQADAARMPFHDEQFSAVVGFLVDSFIGLNFLAEAYRALRRGGFFLMTNPTVQWGHALRAEIEVEAAFTRFVTQTGETVLVPSTLVPGDRLSGMLRHSGFQEVCITPRCLPEGIQSVSPDILASAHAQQTDISQLPILLLVTGRKLQ